MAMPREEKIRDGVGKHVLKRAVSRSCRAKSSGGRSRASARRWRGGSAELGDQLERQLQGSAINELGWLDREAWRTS